MVSTDNCLIVFKTSNCVNVNVTIFKLFCNSIVVFEITEFAVIMPISFYQQLMCDVDMGNYVHQSHSGIC